MQRGFLMSDIEIFQDKIMDSTSRVSVIEVTCRCQYIAGFDVCTNNYRFSELIAKIIELTIPKFCK